MLTHTLAASPFLSLLYYLVHLVKLHFLLLKFASHFYYYPQRESFIVWLATCPLPTKLLNSFGLCFNFQKLCLAFSWFRTFGFGQVLLARSISGSSPCACHLRYVTDLGCPPLLYALRTPAYSLFYFTLLFLLRFSSAFNLFRFGTKLLLRLANAFNFALDILASLSDSLRSSSFVRFIIESVPLYFSPWANFSHPILRVYSSASSPVIV